MIMKTRIMINMTRVRLHVNGDAFRFQILQSTGDTVRYMCNPIGR
jgi:hypothetical protein